MKKGLTGTGLKWIAIITMLIDHIGALIVERAIIKFSVTKPGLCEQLSILDTVLRGIGRIAFPIFCFLLIQGFMYTKNRIKYALRLLAFAFISEIPFDFAFSGRAFYTGYQNVFFTLFIGLVIIIFIDRIWEQQRFSKILRISLCIVCAGIGFFGARFLGVDYGGRGIIAILALYLFRRNLFEQALAGVIAFAWEFPAPFAFIPVFAYNGKRGKGNKYFFYVFYPIHLSVLYITAVLLGLV